MSTHKKIDRICAAAAALCLLLTLLLISGKATVPASSGTAMGYESRLFDTSRVHTIDIVLDNWEGFLAEAQQEEYTVCSVVIDGDSVKNVAIRAKGNTSLSTVASLGSDRYSFKIEFDHYDSGKTYYGLDKLSLNNLIQDTTYMKDYLTYRLMDAFGAAAPLCSYAYLRVNGEDWGLYLAVETIEESFLQRNYGRDYGELYKPDSMSMGGGRGNGKAFDRNTFEPDTGSDAKLQYIDDDPASYSTIFDSAKTDVSQADQQRLIQSLKALSEGDVEKAVDVDAVLRYFVVHNYVVNGDSYTGSMIHNYYLYEKDGLLSMLPWDYNLAFGTFQSTSAAEAVNDDIDTPLSVTGSGDRPMMDWILQNEVYLEQYHQYFTDFLETVDIQGIIRQTAGLIDPYVQKDPTAFYSYEAFQTGVEALEAFCRLRTESVQSQLAGGSGAVVTNLNLSDLGTMNNGGPQQGVEMPQMPEGMQQPDGEMPQMPEGLQQPDGETPQMPEGLQQSDGEMPQMPEGMQQPDGEMPQMPEGLQQPGRAEARRPSPELPLLLASLAALILGLLAAAKFKPRG